MSSEAPSMEAWQGLKRDGYEVIYMTDPVDEYAVQFLKDNAGRCIFAPYHQSAEARSGSGLIKPLCYKMEQGGGWVRHSSHLLALAGIPWL